MLFIALLVGSVFGVLQGRGILAWHSPSWIVPALLFAMLFLAFCKINPRELRLVRWHVILLVIQIVGSMAIFFLVRPYSLLLAQALMLCVLMPTATAAPIITDRLGGNISEITAYVLLSNCMIALLVPVLFPYVNPEVTISYADRLLQILRHITPLLFVPFIGAWALRLIYDAIQRSKGSTKRFQLPAWLASLPFYLWVTLIVILIARTVRQLFDYHWDFATLLITFVSTFVICLVQFFLGKFIGARWGNEPITAGQSLGQKNSALAIWMAQAWLMPLVALAPAAYIIWQNLFNSWQLLHSAKLPNKP